jgi:phosphopantothenoylcysteine decarboxylase/phosphopantothenate--cysteine ligase
VALSRWGQGLVVAPATANVLGKFAHGIADDYLSTFFLANRNPCVVAPAMNHTMWISPAVKENLRTLERRGVQVVPPQTGELACGETGEGRMAEVDDIAEAAVAAFGSEKPLSGKHIVVTAGPTVEELDPVRFLSNHSSGKMGYALARAARLLGADVTLLSGPTALRPPYGVHVVRIRTGADLKTALLKACRKADSLFMAAAVCDFVPSRMPDKIRRRGSLSLSFDAAPDIVAAVKKATGVFTVAFAAETTDLIKHAREKMKDKGVDAIVANDVSHRDIGFGSDVNEAALLIGSKEFRFPKQPKAELALALMKALATHGKLA